MGKDFDAMLGAAVRGFPGAEFFDRIREQPPSGLFALLQRRLRMTERTRTSVARRVASAAIADDAMQSVWRPGRRAALHTHWLYPIASERPEALVAHLRQRGFDATRGASTMYAVPPPDAECASAGEAQRFMERIVYLPVHARMSAPELRSLGEAVVQFERGSASVHSTHATATAETIP
jgi:dTDP-4-amino-4,6-dideoxygalactose transaminase